MKELKIFMIVAAIIGVIYWGVEPLAHSIMHPKGAEIDYAFRDLDKYGAIDYENGKVENGKEVFANNCAGCHGLQTQGISAPFDSQSGGSSFGVVPPDLSHIGYTLDHKFLAHFIKDPVRATLLGNKFELDCSYLKEEEQNACNTNNKGKASFPMPASSALGLQDSDIADVVAYLVSIAPETLNNKQVFIESCSRCHSVEYDRGQYDHIFDPDKKGAYGNPLAAHTPASDVSRYLGTVPPDLSMMIRIKGRHNLSKFINNPQNVPLVDIEHAIMNFHLNKKKDEEKAGLANMSKEEKDARIKEIDLKTAKDYNLELPANSLRDSWQSPNDYTNLARHLGVMPTGKSMPRLGLNERAEEQAIDYLEQVGDSKKEQRERVGIYAIIFMTILSMTAYLWKLKIWRGIH